jgi:hypothetical protein
MSPPDDVPQQGDLDFMVRQLVHAILTLLGTAGLVSAYTWSSRAAPSYADATDTRVFRCELNPQGDPWRATASHWHELTPGGFNCYRRDRGGPLTSRHLRLGEAVSPLKSEPRPKGPTSPQ